MNWIIDRIEEGFAVCEAGSMHINVPLCTLPEGVGEGDVITLTVDKAQTESRKQNISKLMNNLFKD